MYIGQLSTQMNQRGSASICDPFGKVCCITESDNNTKPVMKATMVRPPRSPYIDSYLALEIAVAHVRSRHS